MHRRDVVNPSQWRAHAGYSGSNDAWYARESATLTCPRMGPCHILRKLQPCWKPLRIGERQGEPFERRDKNYQRDQTDPNRQGEGIRGFREYSPGAPISLA